MPPKKVANIAIDESSVPVVSQIEGSDSESGPPALAVSSSDEGASKGPNAPETSDSESDAPDNCGGNSSRKKLLPKKKKLIAAITQDLSAKEKLIKEVVSKKP